tara:strand:- start:69965 stop:71068 length:1104 start_codon:yes stop_codon:yes gene_type:complete
MIPVYQPWLTSKEKNNVHEAMESGWISSTGKYVEKAEELFADFVGTKHAITTTSGTTALHLCLRAMKIEDPKKYVIVPNITFIATAFAASYERMGVLIAEVDPRTWNIDPLQVEHFCSNYDVAAVIPVHLYGNPADMIALKVLQETWGFALIEDACESLGAKIGDKMTGSLGDMSCFSFYGNKTFTSGEGGMVTTDDDEYAERARLLRGQAQDPNKRYWHVDVGHNYRMTNIQAAILCAQLERADQILAEKKRVSDRYLANLGDMDELKFQKVFEDHEHSNWLVSTELLTTKNHIFSTWMRENGVDTRKVFYPISDMPTYKDCETREPPRISRRLSEHGVSFPSYPELSNKEVDHICDLVKNFLLKA